MSNYNKIQLIAYGVVTSEPTRVLTAPTPNDYAADAEVRAQRLSDVADWVASTYAAELADPTTLKLFVVPEFYFRFGGPANPADTLLDSYPNGEQLLPRITEKILRPHFKQATFSDWLVVAGSMFWHKSAAASGTTHPTYFNSALVLRGGQDTDLTPEERATNANPRAVPTMDAVSTNQKALMSHIDYALRIDQREWDAALNPMFGEILRDWEYLRWHMFHVHGVNDAVGRPLVFGLEVCLEHVRARPGDPAGPGVLRTLRATYPTLPEIDVQVVTSCGMDLDPAAGVEARIDGHALLCDGMMKNNHYYTWPRAKHNRVTMINEDTGMRQMGPAVQDQPLAKAVLPPELQLGVGSTHFPPDAVSVWRPAELLTS